MKCFLNISSSGIRPVRLTALQQSITLFKITMKKLCTYLLFAALLAGCSDEYTLTIPVVEAQIQDYYLGNISTTPSTSSPALQMSENGRYLASLTYGDGPSQVKIIDVQSGQVISDFPLRSVTGEGSMGGSVQISNDGKAMLAYTYNSAPGPQDPAITAAIIDPIEKKLIIKGIKNSAAVLYPDGKSLLVSTLGREIVEMSIPDTNTIKKFSFQSVSSAGMITANSRNMFLIVERAGNQPGTEHMIITLWHHATNTKMSEAKLPQRKDGSLWGYTFKTSKDMSLLAFQHLAQNSINTKAYKHQLEIFNTFTGQSIHSFPIVALDVWAYDISPGGRNFIVQEYDTTANTFKKPAIFSISSGSKIAELPLPQGTIPQFSTLAFSSDEKYIYGTYRELTSNQWRLRIWPVQL
jgi:WD40 repeat protein